MQKINWEAATKDLLQSKVQFKRGLEMQMQKEKLEHKLVLNAKRDFGAQAGAGIENPTRKR